MTKIAIAEDIPRLAEMLIQKLKLSDKIQVKWCAKNGSEAIAFLNRDDNIDILLMDINMPVMDGIQATKEISCKWPHLKIIMSTVFDDEENIFNAILAGASGYLMKDESPEYLHQAIDEALAGGAPMSTAIARKALQLIRTGKPSNNIQKEDFGISLREKELLEQLAKGVTYEQIATALFISTGTVRKHIENIYRKLQVNNKMDAVQKAKKNDIIY